MQVSPPGPPRRAGDLFSGSFVVSPVHDLRDDAPRGARRRRPPHAQPARRRQRHQPRAGAATSRRGARDRQPTRRCGRCCSPAPARGSAAAATSRGSPARDDLADPPPLDPRGLARGDHRAGARRRAGRRRGARQRGGRGHGPRRRVRHRDRGRVGEVRDGLHRGRAHARRLVELVPAPPRRPAACARAHAHQPRAVGRGGAGVGADHRRRARRPTCAGEAEALAARLAAGRARRVGGGASGCSTRASKTTFETHLAREAEAIVGGVGHRRGRRRASPPSSRSAARVPGEC